MARILLMDDEEALRAIMVEVLTDEGHEVIDSGTGMIASNTGVVESVDLVITDIIMPDVEGVEVVRTITSLRPDLPILVISGGGRTVTTDYLPLTRHLGANDTMKKPFTPDDLIARVEALLAAPPLTNTAA